MPVPRLIPQVELDRLRRDVQERHSAIDQAYASNGLRPVPYRLTPSALACFSAWYGRRTGSIFEKRLDTYGHRLMVLLAASAGKPEIDEEIAQAVVTLLESQLEIRRELDPVDADNTIAALEEKIRRLLARGPLRLRDLQRKANYHRFGLWAWNTALANLIAAGELQRDPKQDLFWLDPAVITAPATPLPSSAPAALPDGTGAVIEPDESAR